MNNIAHGPGAAYQTAGDLAMLPCGRYLAAQASPAARLHATVWAPHMRTCWPGICTDWHQTADSRWALIGNAVRGVDAGISSNLIIRSCDVTDQDGTKKGGAP